MSKKILAVLTLLSVLAAVGGVFVYKNSLDEQAGNQVKKAIESKPKIQSEMTEKERLAYVEKFIVIEDLVVEPDTQIGPEGKTVEIKGLLRVKGVARNTGAKTVNKALLILHVKNDQDEVIGTDIQDILGGRKLLESEEREFSFKIRDRKEFTNRYLTKVR